MGNKLPIAIVIPHSGLETPPELQDRVVLTDEQIFNEADVYTDLIYDFRDNVAEWHAFPYARSIIDVNRPNHPMPQLKEGDGIVKSQTSYGTPVYTSETEPSDELEAQLIEKYWQPWHDTMAKISEDDSIKLVLDCHSMAAVGPTTYLDPSQIRPRITASNLGDENAQQKEDGPSLVASPELTLLIAKKFGGALVDLPDLAPTSAPYDVNQPYSGGPIIWIHGGKTQPWLMIELSRATYIDGEQTGDSPVQPPNTERITQIRDNLWQAIEEIVKTL